MSHPAGLNCPKGKRRLSRGIDGKANCASRRPYFASRLDVVMEATA
jgi:hypothetical protein